MYMQLVSVIFIAIYGTIAQAANMFPNEIFITLKDSGELAQFPKHKVWKAHPVMLYNSITPDGKRLVVSSPKQQSVYVFDSKTHKQLAAIKVGKASKGLKVSPNSKEVYVANEGEASVSVVDLVNYKNVATIQTEEMPHNIRFSNDGKIAYVTLQGGAGLGVIDTNTRKVLKVIKTPGIPTPHNLDLSADGQTAFIRDTSSNVGVLNLKTEQIEKVIPVGQGHAGIDVSADGKYVITGAIADEIVTVIDAKNYQILKQIKVGFGSHGVRTSADGRWLYVVVTADDKLVVIDTQNWSIVKETSLASFPFWLAVKDNP